MPDVSELKDAAANGDMDAIEELSALYFNQMDYQNASYWAREGAAVHNAWCLHLLGTIARDQRNFREAEQWYSRNININGDSLSASNLGFIYLNPNDEPDMPKDLDRTEYYFQLSMKKDNQNPEAAFGLAICILNHDNVDMNQVKSLLQITYRNGTGEVKDAAQDLLRDIQNNERSGNNNNNNNNGNNSSGGGCFITTAVCDSLGKADDCYELTMFRNFRDNWLINQSDGKSLIDEYYSTAPAIVDKINKITDSPQIYKTIWNEYLKPCLANIERGDFSECKRIYISMVNNLRNTYLK